jgi:hypothetical protein
MRTTGSVSALRRPHNEWLPRKMSCPFTPKSCEAVYVGEVLSVKFSADTPSAARPAVLRAVEGRQEEIVPVVGEASGRQRLSLGR